MGSVALVGSSSCGKSTLAARDAGIHEDILKMPGGYQRT